MSNNANKTSVFVIEEDHAIGWFLEKILTTAGYDVLWQTEAAFAVDFVYSPDLIILDLSLSLHLPTRLLTDIRGRFEASAILVLSDRSSMGDRLEYFDLGADDFVLKPFSVLEVLARCRCLLRNRDHVSNHAERFGNLELNQLTRTVRHRGEEVRLTTREYKLLRCLILKRGEPCLRVDLLREVWPSHADSNTNIVDVYISYLRRKLDGARHDGEPHVSAIQTVHGHGYRLRHMPSIMPHGNVLHAVKSVHLTHDNDFSVMPSM